MALPNRFEQVSPVITSAELVQRVASRTAPLMVDVREADEFAAGHIPGALNVPLSTFTAAFRTLPRDREIALVCRSGNRSGMAQRFLMGQGYAATRNLIDGMLGWSGPVER